MIYNSKKSLMKKPIDEIVLHGILSIVDAANWTGTMTELNSALTRTVGRKNSKMLPGSPGALRVVLNRVVNRLRTRGVSVIFNRTTDHARTRYVKFSIEM